MFSHVKQEELHNKSSVVQRSLLVVSYLGPSSVSVGGLCVAACIYVAEFNRVGLQRKSVLNRVVLEMLLTNAVETTMWRVGVFWYSFQIVIQAFAFLTFCNLQGTQQLCLRAASVNTVGLISLLFFHDSSCRREMLLRHLHFIFRTPYFYCFYLQWNKFLSLLN